LLFERTSLCCVLHEGEPIISGKYYKRLMDWRVGLHISPNSRCFTHSLPIHPVYKIEARQNHSQAAENTIIKNDHNDTKIVFFTSEMGW